jgi:hypothetical protein
MIFASKIPKTSAFCLVSQWFWVLVLPVVRGGCLVLIGPPLGPLGFNSPNIANLSLRTGHDPEESLVTGQTEA